MKIAYLSLSKIPSKAANSIHIMKMCSALSKNNNTVSLFYPNRRNINKNITDIYSHYGVVNNFKLIKSWWPSIKGKTFIFSILISLRAKLMKFDIVYSRDPFITFFCILFNQKVVYEIHQDISDYGKIALNLFKFVIKSKSLVKIIVITNALKNELLKNYKIKPKLLYVSPDGADIIKKDIKPTNKIIKNDKLIVGYIGHLYKGRGIEIIIFLSVKCPWAEFHVVGGNKEDILYWKNKTANQSNIHFHGFVAPHKVSSYQISCDVLLAPYQNKVSVSSKSNISTEKWMSPLKIFEYMAAKKAIVCSDIPVLREVLVNDYNCILCKNDDMDLWVLALKKLKDDHAFRNLISNNAYQDFKEKYSWNSRAHSIIKNLNL